MTKKHTQTTLDVSIEYAVIGLDLAKYGVSLTAVTLNEGEIIRIDRVTYAELYVSSPLVPPRFDAMTENGNSSLGVSHEQILHLASGIQRLP